MNILLNHQGIEQLLHNVVMVSAVTISLYDGNMRPFSETHNNMCEFCRSMRLDPSFADKCTCSNETAFHMVEQTHDTYIYQCHAGLTEVAAPILAQNKLLGFLMMGQFIPKEQENTIWQEIQERCHAYAHQLPSEEEFFLQTRILSRPEIIAWIEIVQACASYLWTNQYITAMNDEMFVAFDHYVHTHLAESFCAADICRDLLIPRNRLYSMVRNNTGMSVGDYIWAARIDRAKELLANTDLPVFQVALQAGISDYGYFTKAFRKHTGITPSQYRKRQTAPAPGDTVSTICPTES
ncbi:MAG: helix-turn-helix domain-containing protein [Massiliimalia sp.]|jgi:AraC-like DNA-binding protein